MTATINAPAVTLDEAAAAAEEGLLPMPSDLVALRNEKLKLKEKREIIEAREREIRDIFGARLEQAGAQGFTLNGKVHARRSEVKTSRIDSKALKLAHPKLWVAFSKITESIRVVID